MTATTLVLGGAVLVLTSCLLTAAVRLLIGPDDANRAAAADLVFFSVVGLFALAAVLIRSDSVFDLVLVATTIGFLASLALARAVNRGGR
ncbi:MAG: monovalent cation/H+ antiporter complex subunit F [Luteococcus japonicus]